MLLDLTKDSTQKELDLADLEHKERVKEIETKFKDEADLKARLLKQESEYYEKTRTAAIVTGKPKATFRAGTIRNFHAGNYVVLWSKDRGGRGAKAISNFRNSKKIRNKKTKRFNL